MDTADLLTPKPAQLLRRMLAPSAAGEATISRDGAEPMARFLVEAIRGRLIMRLAAAPADDTAIQWTQNGGLIAGATGPVLHLAALTPDDGDVYYACLRGAAGEARSQSFLVVVVPGNPLLNFSARGRVGPGHPLIAGFVIGRVARPVAPQRYLIRALGDSLRRFGVTETLPHPVAELHRGRVRLPDLVRSDEQAVLAREAAAAVGAFAVAADARDLAGVVELNPGPHSLIVTGGEGESGEVLVEIYEMPA